MDNKLRKFALLLIVFISAQSIFAVGAREQVKAEVKALVKEGNIEKALTIMRERYNENPDEFDIWFDRTTSDILKIEREHTKVVNELISILEKGSKGITDDDQVRMYDLINEMLEIKPIVSEDDPNMVLVRQVTLLAGSIANVRKVNALMNEAFISLSSGSFVEASGKYVSGFDINSDVFEQSDFNADVKTETYQIIDTIIKLSEKLDTQLALLNAANTNFLSIKDSATLIELSDSINDVLYNLNELTQIRTDILIENKKLLNVEKKLIAEYGSNKDYFYFRFLDFLVTGRTAKLRNENSIALDAKEGLLAAYEIPWLKSAEPILVTVKSRIQALLKIAGISLNYGSFEEAMPQYYEAAESAELLFIILESWQQYLYLGSDGSITEAGDPLYSNRPLDDVIISNFLYARTVFKFVDILDVLQLESKKYDEIMAGSEDEKDFTRLFEKRVELIKGPVYLQSLKDSLSTDSLMFDDLDKKGYRIDIAQAVLDDGIIGQLDNLINKNHGFEAFLANQLFIYRYEALTKRYAEMNKALLKAESKIKELTEEEVSDLHDGFVVISYPGESERQFKALEGTISELASESLGLAEEMDEEETYILSDSVYSATRLNLRTLQGNIKNSEVFINDRILEIDFIRTSQLSEKLVKILTDKFEAQRTLYVEGRRRLEQTALAEDSEIKVLENTGSRDLTAFYPQKSAEIVIGVRSELEKMVTHADLINEKLTDTLTNYQSSELLVSNLNKVKQIQQDIQNYLEGVERTLEQVDVIFAVNSTAARYNPMNGDYNKLVEQLRDAYTIADRVNVHTDTSIEGIASVKVNYTAESDISATDAIAGFNLLIEEAGFVISVLNEQNIYVRQDFDFLTALNDIRVLGENAQKRINEAEKFIFNQRATLVDSIAVAHTERISDQITLHKRNMDGISEGDPGSISSRPVSYPGVPVITLDYNHASLQVYNDNMDGMTSLQKEGDIIISYLKSSDYFSTSTVIPGQIEEIKILKDLVNTEKKKYENYEYTLERDFKIKYAIKLYEILKDDLESLRVEYNDALSRETTILTLIKNIFPSYSSLTVSANFPQYTVNKINSMNKKLLPLKEQINNAYNLLGGSEFGPYSSDNEEISAQKENIKNLLSDAENFIKSSSDYKAGIETDYLTEIYRERNQIITDEFIKLQEDFDKAKQLMEGSDEVEYINGEVIPVLKRYPGDAQTLLYKAPGLADKFIKKVEAVQDSINDENISTRQDSRINEISTNLSSVEKKADTFKKDVSALNKEASKQGESANSLRISGERALSKAKVQIKDEDYSLARKTINNASADLTESYLLSWDSRLFGIVQTDIDKLRGDIARQLQVRIYTVITELIDTAIDAKNIGEYRKALNYLNQAETKWSEVSTEENSEIAWHMARINAALKSNTGREVLRNDPMYEVISSYLNNAAQSMKDALIYENQGNPELKKTALADARKNINLIKRTFPKNREANILALELEKIDDPENFYNYLSDEFDEADKLHKNKKLDEALNKFKEIQALDPNFRNVGNKIIQIEIENGTRSNIKEDDKKEADALVKKVEKVLEKRFQKKVVYIQAEKDIKKAIKLNPEHPNARLVRNKLIVRMNEDGVPPSGQGNILTPADQRILDQVRILLGKNTSADELAAYTLLKELYKRGDNKDNTEVVAEVKKMEKSGWSFD